MSTKTPVMGKAIKPAIENPETILFDFISKYIVLSEEEKQAIIELDIFRIVKKDQLKFFNERFFIEPSIAITHRPFHTKMPESFAELDNKWSNFCVHSNKLKNE